MHSAFSILSCSWVKWRTAKVGTEPSSQWVHVLGSYTDIDNAVGTEPSTQWVRVGFIYYTVVVKLHSPVVLVLILRPNWYVWVLIRIATARFKCGHVQTREPSKHKRCGCLKVCIGFLKVLIGILKVLTSIL